MAALTASAGAADLVSLVDDDSAASASTAGASRPQMLAVASANSAALGSAAAELGEFLVNLARYASWPADPARREITVCFAHGGGLPASAMIIEDATSIRGMAVATRVIQTPAQVGGCNLLWLNADVRPAPRNWLASVGERPILTVSNYADFTADGGIIGAYRQNGDWRFEINLESLQRSRVNIAAAALRLSQRPKVIRSNGELK